MMSDWDEQQRMTIHSALEQKHLDHRSKRRWRCWMNWKVDLKSRQNLMETELELKQSYRDTWKALMTQMAVSMMDAEVNELERVAERPNQIQIA
jgi:hypothetical protein